MILFYINELTSAICITQRERGLLLYYLLNNKNNCIIIIQFDAYEIAVIIVTHQLLMCVRHSLCQRLSLRDGVISRITRKICFFQLIVLPLIARIAGPAVNFHISPSLPDRTVQFPYKISRSTIVSHFRVHFLPSLFVRFMIFSSFDFFLI